MFTKIFRVGGDASFKTIEGIIFEGNVSFHVKAGDISIGNIIKASKTPPQC